MASTADDRDDRPVFLAPDAEPERLAAALSAFIQMPVALFDDARLGDGEKMAYLALRRYAWRTGRCWQGQDALAGELGIQVRQLRRRIEVLINCGYIAAERRGKRRTNVYVLLPMAPSDRSEMTGHRDPAERVTGHKCPVTEGGDRSQMSGPIAVDESLRVDEQEIPRSEPNGSSRGATASKGDHWLQRLGDPYAERIGRFEYPKNGRLLKPLRAEIGDDDRLLAAWMRWLDSDDVRFGVATFVRNWRRYDAAAASPAHTGLALQRRTFDPGEFRRLVRAQGGQTL